MKQSLTVKQLSELAQEAGSVDEVNFKDLKLTKDSAYDLMASSVIEQFTALSEEEKLPVALATITNLLVENFVANLRLESLKG